MNSQLPKETSSIQDPVNETVPDFVPTRSEFYPFLRVLRGAAIYRKPKIHRHFLHFREG
jgi:hypothetical protein